MAAAQLSAPEVHSTVEEDPSSSEPPASKQVKALPSKVKMYIKL
jgi:hypothetical protein